MSEFTSGSIRLIAFGPVLVAAVTSFVLVRAWQGDGSTLVERQRHDPALTPGAVARIVRAAPDPANGQQGQQASCEALGNGVLLNPWRCSISYASGLRVRFLVTIRADGSYAGDHQSVRRGDTYIKSNGTISGCCIVIP